MPIKKFFDQYEPTFKEIINSFKVQKIVSDEKDFHPREALRHRNNLKGRRGHGRAGGGRVFVACAAEDRGGSVSVLSQGQGTRYAAAGRKTLEEGASGGVATGPRGRARWISLSGKSSTELAIGPFGIPVPKTPQAIDPDILWSFRCWCSISAATALATGAAIMTRR